MRDRQEITMLYDRAIKNARAKGFDQEAEDFASWVTIKYLEGKSQHQTLDQSFIEYRRKHHGNPRTRGYRARKSAESHYITLTPLESDEKGQAELRSAERSFVDVSGESEDYRREDPDPSIHLSGRDLIAYQLVYQEELTLKEAGELLGVTESRMSQILKRVTTDIAHAVARPLMLADMRERVEQGDTEFRIDWITL